MPARRPLDTRLPLARSTVTNRERIRCSSSRLGEYSAGHCQKAQRCGLLDDDSPTAGIAGDRSRFKGSDMIDAIIDLYHLNTANLVTAMAGGIVAVIHKATEGATVKDAEYRKRRDKARALGLLWGAYHYSSGVSVADQVANFLEHALPGENYLVALDWESSTSGPDMTLDQACRFVEMIKSELGRWPVVYGGRLLRETVGAKRQAALANCPLWYSRYATAPIGIPTATWPTYTLWQYTDGNSGPLPHTVKGIGRCDRNRFAGTIDDLKLQWPFSRKDEGVAFGPGGQILMAQVDSIPPRPARVHVAGTRRARKKRR
jgi:lysozyme